MKPFDQQEKWWRAGLFLLAGLYLVVLYRTAWLSDDAYITYRCVDNLVNGYGLTFNPGQRVQAFTNPLWAFLHIPLRWLIEDMFAIGLLLALGTTLVAVGLMVVKLTRHIAIRVWLLAALISSAAFMDYSSSGLENPLTHLLLLGFACLYLSPQAYPRRLLLLSAFTGLLLLNRMDSVLLVAPALCFVWWQQRSLRSFGLVCLGLMPFFLWEIVATIYYGFPFPMTAYAKLNTSLPRFDLWGQGLYYLGDFIRHDPFSALVLAGGLIAPFIWKKKFLYPLVAGIFLYLMYIVYIGGDFMRGRFFAAPFFLALISLSQLIRPVHIPYLLPTAVVLGLLGTNPPLLSHAALGKGQFKEGFINPHGIANERVFYFQATGLIATQGRELPDFEWVTTGKNWRKQARTFFITESLGFKGYFAGPTKHLIDPNALSEPFLAQLPNVYRSDWRPGHNRRLIPRGYLQSLEQGSNELLSPQLREVYAATELLTRGPIWDAARFKVIWEMNVTDKYANLIDRAFYTLPVAAKVPESALPTFNQQTILTHSDAGFQLDLTQPKGLKKLEIQMQQNCEYTCVFRLGNHIVDGKKIIPRHQSPDWTRVEIPAPDLHIDNIILYPNTYHYPCKVKEIRLHEQPR